MSNMRGDPSQQNPPSIFNLEPYPPLNSQPFDWNRIPNQEPPVSLIPQGPFLDSTSNYVQPQPALGNFSFYTGETPHLMQFPFPTTTPCVTPTASIEKVFPSISGENVFLTASTENVFPTAATQNPFSTTTIQNVFPTTSVERVFTPQPSLRCKRKTESPPLQPIKQHITEEKMAEHMSKLHISSETPKSKETESDRVKRLYMCEEMRKLQHDMILPQSLLARIERPCTALVLWTPPHRLIPLNNDTENKNNNEESVPDANVMDLDSV